jgi:large subunit ribosomal protein L19
MENVEKNFLRTDLPAFRPGDSVVVNVRIKEGDKERIQAYEGAVIRKRGRGISTTFTVRKISYGVGVERIFPLYAPTIESIVVKEKGNARRARLYYMRELQGKAARRALREKA